jgi:succinate dehydrogenase / fumarate reductase, cytochrome b subunit
MAGRADVKVGASHTLTEGAEAVGAAGARTSRGRRAFLFSRLASVLAIAPLGVWTCVHLWENLAVWSGGAAWEASVTGHRHPVALVVTSIVVLAPLVLHTFWGLWRLRTVRPNNGRYGYYANLKYVIQRVSAVGVLFFIGAHLWLAFIKPRFLLGRAETFADMSYHMRHHEPTLVVYILGTLGVAYHLANGVYGFAMGWGLTSSRSSLKRLEWAVIALFLVLLAMSWGTLYGLWRAGA